MQIKILFDSKALDNRLTTGWGVSYLVNNKVLFDTGEKPDKLLKNMRNMGVSITGIDTIVISHDHWDHRGGLWGILKENPKMKVYICPLFSSRFKNRVKSYGGKLIEVDRFSQIDDNIYTTGEIEGRYAGRYIAEQALVLKIGKDIIILTGCAHPGVTNIVQNVKQSIHGDIYLVLGGFHLIGRHAKTIKSIMDEFKQLKVRKVAPSHCSGKNAVNIFREEYKGDFIEIKAGQIITI